MENTMHNMNNSDDELHAALSKAESEVIDGKIAGAIDDSNTILENILLHKCENQTIVVGPPAMTSSVASIPDDSTPSDSGVQLLDSISSGMNESFMSNSGFDLDTSYPAEYINNVALIKQLQESADALALQFDVGIDNSENQGLEAKAEKKYVVEHAEIQQIKQKVDLVAEPFSLTKSDIDNSNVVPNVVRQTDFSIVTDIIDMQEIVDIPQEVNMAGIENIPGTATVEDITEKANVFDIPDEMVTSTCSTFDTENIVYRRKVKKQRTSSTSSNGGSKKRVSFHEDILKNTKTDNIHIEHGFITYKGYSKKQPHPVSRYSWCSQGDSDDYRDEVPHNIYYRNACSDVLDYGKTDLYDQADSALIQYDHSGVFEYGPQMAPVEPANANNNPSPDLKKNHDFYQCKCSSSNSSLESGDSSNSMDYENNKKRNYTQAKSSSCDCIGIAHNIENNNVCGARSQPIINDNCYFSEPSIETLDETFEIIGPKSVWRKEMKPNGSCLKKTKRQTGVVQEQDLATKVKKFNVHQLSDMNNLIGSLKNIFSLTLPERGVPEGCEDLQPVYECLPDVDNSSPVNKPKSFLSKSFDNGLEKKKKKDRPKNFVHAVDEQLRRKNDPSPEVPIEVKTITDAPVNECVPTPSNYRNKYIINCESTVFEHTGVFYENGNGASQTSPVPPLMPILPSNASKPVISTSATPFTQKLSNMFKSFRDSSPALKSQDKAQEPLPPHPQDISEQNQHQNTEFQQQMLPSSPKKPEKSKQSPYQTHQPAQQDIRQTIQQNVLPDYQLPTYQPERQKQPNMCKHKNQEQIQQNARQTTPQHSQPPRKPSFNLANKSNETDSFGTASMTSSMMSSTSDKNSNIFSNTMVTHDLVVNDFARAIQPDPSSPTNGKSRHLASPLHRRPITSRFDRSRLSPDLFGGAQHDPVNPMDLVSQEFDDLLTITTTDTDFNDSDIEILDYPSCSDILQASQAKEQIPDISNSFLRPPSSKSSLINRFLRNVTQKKIQDATIKKNNILSAKYKQAPRMFGNLYVKTPKPIDLDMVADLNAEIALEIEMNGRGTKEVQEVAKPRPNIVNLKNEFGVGVGEVSVDIFNGNTLHILRDDKEILMKVFKLYTGYSLEGHMTPVLVFLTDKTLYVTDLVRNRLCNKFVLPYTELDVILIGPHGNTVLLSNSARDMQQVLLAGGPYPTDGLVSSLEMSARRGGAKLPAVGQLTLDHLAPLQSFVRENSSVSKNDAWVYYAVVSVPANILNHDEEPLGPNIKGFLMHRSLSFSVDQSQQWHAGYFLLKTGVLYMFSDSNQKLPSMTICLSECKGARRAFNSPRPHCFELILKTGFLQLAAPDEYVASDWLQTLVQSASGLFEMQEKNKTLGCTIVITSNHLITLREDFAAPLRRLNAAGVESPRKTSVGNVPRKLSTSTNISETMNETCSNMSTSTRMSDRFSSAKSSPCRSQTSIVHGGKSFSSISSIYGKNSGVEVKTCAALQEMVSIRIPGHSDHWWCILEFSCQEVQENSDDMVVFFATNSDMRRFLAMLESLWQTKKDTPFPIFVLPEDDAIGKHCGDVFVELNRSWEPLLTAALGYPQ